MTEGGGRLGEGAGDGGGVGVPGEVVVRIEGDEAFVPVAVLEFDEVAGEGVEDFVAEGEAGEGGF